MFCVNCGADIPDGALFCTVCGARINTAPVPDTESQAMGGAQVWGAGSYIVDGTPSWETGWQAAEGTSWTDAYGNPILNKQPEYMPPASEPGKPLPPTKVGEKGGAAAAAFAVIAVAAALLFVCFCKPGFILKMLGADGEKEAVSAVSEEEEKDVGEKEEGGGKKDKDKEKDEDKDKKDGIDLEEIEALKEERFGDMDTIVLNYYYSGSADNYAVTLGYDSSYDWNVSASRADEVVIRSEEMEIEVTLGTAVRDVEDWEITREKRMDDREYGEFSLKDGREGYYYHASTINTGLSGVVNLGPAYQGVDKELSDKKDNILTFTLAGWDYEGTEFERDFLEDVLIPILDEAVTEPITEAP